MPPCLAMAIPTSELAVALGAVVICMIAWPLTVVLAAKLEAEVGWKRRAWRLGDRCLVCAYSLQGLQDGAVCPECGQDPAAPASFTLPIAWFVALGLVALGAVPAMCVLGIGGAAGYGPWALWACLLGTPGLTIAGGLTACLWPAGARMRWSMAAVVLGGGVAIVAAALLADVHLSAAESEFGAGFALAAAGAVVLVPMLMGLGIGLGVLLNRQIPPRRPWLS